jgi:PhzF family phenazine biosynthesis protein
MGFLLRVLGNALARDHRGARKIKAMRIPLFHVNAFATQPSRGNPAAVCLLDFWLDDHLLQKVAAENNLSATAFLVPGGDGHELRWFSPRCEIQLCGHATLAAAHVVLKLLTPERNAAQFCTRFRGNLMVRKDGDLLSMDLPVTTAKPCAPLPAVLQALRVPQASEIVEFLKTNDTCIVVLQSSTAVQQIRPDFASLEKLHPLVVLITAQAEDVDFVCRYFAPSYGLPEDPVTGSAQCLLAPYWSNRLGKVEMRARQLSERGGELWCEINGDRVWVKGESVLTLQGSLEF